MKSRKAMNVRRNGNVTVLFDVEGPPTRVVIIYGRAELEKLSIDDMILEGMSIFRRYMTEDKTQTYAEGLSKISEWLLLTIQRMNFTEKPLKDYYKHCITFLNLNTYSQLNQLLSCLEKKRGVVSLIL